jgi:hypothetical protein
VHKINKALNDKYYCSADFLDISQAFNKVWHTELLYMLRKSLPQNYYLILKSYLHGRHFHVKFAQQYTELFPVKVGVPQGRVLGALLYLLHTADIPTSPDTTTATFADDTAVLATDSDPAIASQKLQTGLPAIQHYLKTWRMKVNGSKSTHITFTTRRETCPPVLINNIQLPQAKEGKYLGVHLDSRFTWRNHIFAKRKQLGTTHTKMYLLLGRQSRLTTSNKLLGYIVVLKPIWTYGLQLWGTASTSNIEIHQRFQSKALHMITNAAWYVPNVVLRHDLHIPSVKEEIQSLSSQYSARLNSHPNLLTANLEKQSTNRHLRCLLPTDLPNRFLL